MFFTEVAPLGWYRVPWTSALTLCVLLVIYFNFCANVLAGVPLHDVLTLESVHFGFQASLLDVVVAAAALHLALLVRQWMTRSRRSHHDPKMAPTLPAHEPVGGRLRLLFALS